MSQTGRTCFKMVYLYVLSVFLVPSISCSAIQDKDNSSEEVNDITFNVTGLMAAVLTPLNENQTVNLEVIPAYANHLINNQVKAILIGGSSGEHMSLSVNDRKKVIDAWVDACKNHDMHIQAQVGGAPYADVIDLAKYCNSNGVHSILTLPDLYFKPHTVDELVFYVEKVASAAPDLPVFYYHVPKKTNVNIKMPEFAQAAQKIPNFMGIKSTSTDLDEASTVVRNLRGKVKVMLGGEALLAPATLLGIDTCVSPAVSLFAGLMRAIQNAVNNNDVRQAMSLQDKLTSMVSSLTALGGRIPAMKVALETATEIKIGPPALPTKPVTDNQRKYIEELWKHHGYGDYQTENNF